jgi:molybdate transport system ATP-binding protein
MVVTHDRMDALALGDHIVVLEGGRILQQGPVLEVFNRPASLAVAGIVMVETVCPGRVQAVADDLVTVAVGEVELTALAGDILAGVGVYVCVRGEDVMLTRAVVEKSSPRNRLPATVVSLVREGAMNRIELDCGFPLKALLTKQACEEMALQEGDRVVAMIKAPHIHLIPRAG